MHEPSVGIAQLLYELCEWHPYVINGIFEAQDTLAQRTIAGQEAKALAPDSRRRWIETLKLDAVAVLLIIAFATAVLPSLPSRVAQEIFQHDRGISTLIRPHPPHLPSSRSRSSKR